MDRMSHGCDAFATEPLPYVRGLQRANPRVSARRHLNTYGAKFGTATKSTSRFCNLAGNRHGAIRSRLDSQVWRRLHPTRDEPEPTDSAFSQARRRLGVAPLRQLFLETARPMATHETLCASYRGFRLMGLDGTTLDLPDTPENARTFRTALQRAVRGGFPPGPFAGTL